MHGLCIVLEILSLIVELYNLFCNAYDVSGTICWKFQCSRRCQRDMEEFICTVNIDGCGQ